MSDLSIVDFESQELTSEIWEKVKKMNIKLSGEPVHIPDDQEGKAGKPEWYSFTFNHPTFPESISSYAFSKKQEYTYIVTTPDNDRTPIKATDCVVESGCLILEDEAGDIVMAYAPGHWVKMQRVESEKSDS